MTYREKLTHFQEDLRRRGMWRSNALPPAFWWLVKLGFEVPPPYFVSFGRAWLTAGVPFGILFGLSLVVMVWLLRPGWAAVFTGSGVAFAAVGSGTLFGLCMALAWGWQRDRMKLPRWQEYPVEATGPDAGAAGHATPASHEQPNRGIPLGS